MPAQVELYAKGSFRDPDSWVSQSETKEVVRRYSEKGAARLDELTSNEVWEKLIERKYITRPQNLELNSAAPHSVHKKITCWNYPYEWSPNILLEAATFHLEMVLLLGEHGWTTVDASSFNVVLQTDGFEFIDFGSFVKRRKGEPWWAYQEFCEHFLYPLMINAYLELSPRRLLQAGLGKVAVADAAKLLKKYRLKPGVLQHVLMPAKLAGKDQTVDEGRDISRKLPGDAHQDVVRSLLKLVKKLSVQPDSSAWGDYSNREHYSQSSLETKSERIGEIVSMLQPEVLLDVGGNDGAFSKYYSEVDQVVVADFAEDVIDRLYLGDRQENVLPLVLDICNPTPALGWANDERSSFFDRVKPDLVLMLAVVHHLAITGTIPFREIARWAGQTEAQFVVEFVDRDDEKVQHLLARKVEEFPYSEQDMVDAFASEGFSNQFLGKTSDTRNLWLFSKES